MGKKSNLGQNRRPLSAAVVVTVLNEAGSITDLVTALKNQTFPPAEVVITDGGSTDATWPILQKLARSWSRLRVYQVPGNRSLGRNAAVAKTTSPIIAFTDAGCLPDPDWLPELVRPFTDKNVQVVSGYYRGQANSVFEKCLIPYVLVMPDRASQTEFFPSSRSMSLRRSIWDKVGGFNPRVDPSEDYELAHRLKKLGVGFFFTPRAQVVWQPRQNLSQVAWMFLRFAFGDIQAGLLRPKVKILALRYILFFYLFFLSLQIPWLFIPLIGLGLAYLVWAIGKNYRYVNNWRALYWLPVLQITADMTVLFGTIMGMIAYQKSKKI